ncbi:MAG TPA: S-adenosylmethionine:tRNA ribosyltransferase-isomerase [Bacteroides sp.]|nr:S-adenosylmethionine:tRNA ribosyltransferase-isomerase [Bacteroides sp.]
MTASGFLDISSFLYPLPGEQIAKYPLPDRDQSRLLFYNQGAISHHRFLDLPSLIPESSRVVFNNTKVIRARLEFRKPTGARIEVFCLEPAEPADYRQSFQATAGCTWKCMVGNMKKWKEGPVFLHVTIAGENLTIEARLVTRSDEHALVRFRWNNNRFTFNEIVDSAGNTPIPPYLKRDAEPMDRERYQTIYGTENGSVAAPTAGLHFTGRMMQAMVAQGIETGELTLHVGAGTFVPVKEKNARDHQMHAENVIVGCSFLEAWIKQSSPVIAIGTTTTRSLESMYWLGVKLLRGEGIRADRIAVEQWEHESLPGDIPLKDSLGALLELCRIKRLEVLRFSTRLMIVPGYRFRTIGGLVTNFHLPGSTLLLLIAAFIGEEWTRVYADALAQGYRFLSYGDSSLLVPREL